MSNKIILSNSFDSNSNPSIIIKSFSKGLISQAIPLELFPK